VRRYSQLNILSMQRIKGSGIIDYYSPTLTPPGIIVPLSPKIAILFNVI